MSAGAIIGTVIGVVFVLLFLVSVVLSGSDKKEGAEKEYISRYAVQIRGSNKPTPDPIMVESRKNANVLLEELNSKLTNDQKERLDVMRGQFFQTFKGNLNIDEINDSRRAKTIDNMDVDFINKIKGYTLKIADNSGPEKHVDDYKKYFDYYVGNALMKEDTKADIRMRIGIIEKMAQKTPETEGGRIYKIKTNALALFDILYILVPRDNDPLVDYISKPNYGGRKPKSKPKKRK